MLERDVEKKVCDYAKTKGFLTYKFVSPARASVPDRLFISPDGQMFFVEMKRYGQRPTSAQQREHDRLRSHNVFVFVIDNASCFLTTYLVNSLFRSEFKQMLECWSTQSMLDPSNTSTITKNQDEKLNLKNGEL